MGSSCTIRLLCDTHPDFCSLLPTAVGEKGVDCCQSMLTRLTKVRGIGLSKLDGFKTCGLFLTEFLVPRMAIICKDSAFLCVPMTDLLHERVDDLECHPLLPGDFEEVVDVDADLRLALRDFTDFHSIMIILGVLDDGMLAVGQLVMGRHKESDALWRALFAEDPLDHSVYAFRISDATGTSRVFDERGLLRYYRYLISPTQAFRPSESMSVEALAMNGCFVAEMEVRAALNPSIDDMLKKHIDVKRMVSNCSNIVIHRSFESVHFFNSLSLVSHSTAVAAAGQEEPWERPEEPPETTDEYPPQSTHPPKRWRKRKQLVAPSHPDSHVDLYFKRIVGQKTHKNKLRCSLYRDDATGAMGYTCCWEWHIRNSPNLFGSLRQAARAYDDNFARNVYRHLYIDSEYKHSLSDTREEDTTGSIRQLLSILEMKSRRKRSTLCDGAQRDSPPSQSS